MFCSQPCFCLLGIVLLHWLPTQALFAQPEPEAFRFEASTVDGNLGGLTAVTIGPDGHLYVQEEDGDILRRQIDRSTGLPTGSTELLFNNTTEERFAIGLEFSPNATSGNLEAYVSYAEPNGTDQSNVARITLPSVGDTAVLTVSDRTDVITGLTVGLGNHTTNQFDFGPDGRLYFQLGSTSGPGNDSETPLSAATLVADVLDPNFTPVDVGGNYDPNAPGAPVQVYATGLRNAYDLVFHSNGNLYVPINGNDSGGSTVDDPSTPLNESVANNFNETLALVSEGSFHGHPNPDRDEFVLFGGNPTAGVDPFEVPALPVGVQPNPNFDPNANFDLIANQPTGQNFGSISPNGIDEFGGNTDLQGSLLIAFFRFGGPATIQTVQLDENGIPTSFNPILDEAGDLLILVGALDLTVDDTTGRIYVATRNGINSGNLIVLDPIADASPELAGDYNDDGFVNAADFTLFRDSFGAAHGTLANDGIGGAIGDLQFQQFTGSFGATAPSSSAGQAIPEPMTMSVLLFGCGLASCGRYRCDSMV